MSGPTMDRRLAEWFASDDTGISSKAIALWMSAQVRYGRWGHSTPSDGGDFGRCYRLLKLFPEWRERLSEMADAGEFWATYVKRWPEIEAVYERELAQPTKQGSCPTYDLMKAVEDQAYDEAGWITQCDERGFAWWRHRPTLATVAADRGGRDGAD